MDCCDVRVDEYDPDALLSERLDGLSPRIVELPGFANLDRTGAEDQYLPYAFPLWNSLAAFAKSSNRKPVS